MLRVGIFLKTFLLFILTYSINADAQNIHDKLKSENLGASYQSVNQDEKEVNKWDYFIYPVPAIDFLNIMITKGNVTIYKLIITNEDGNEIFVLDNQNSDKLKINIENFKPGKYIIQIVSSSYQDAIMKRFYVIN